MQCFGAALLAMSMFAGCGTSQTANQAESESTEENLVPMEETLPQTGLRMRRSWPFSGWSAASVC